MAYRVLLSAKAEGDVEAVLKWFRDQRATEAGGRWLALLMSKLDTLESRPERCSLADESDEIGAEIRELLMGRKRFQYRLLFKIEGKTVQILRIWHSSRDFITRDDV